MSDVRQGLFDLLKGIIDDEWGPYGDDYYWDMVDAELPRLGLMEERLTVPMTPNPPAVGRNGRWVKLGDVSVDSSQMVICDPGYAKKFDVNAYWNASRQVTDDLDVQNWNSGVAFTAGFGDGGYDVWGWIVDYGEDGELDERVAQVVVTLIDSEDLDQWNADI